MDKAENAQSTVPSGRTEQKTRMLLDEEKYFYSGIIQNAAAPILVINSSHTILFWNNALAKMTGISSFQMKGTKRHWSAFYPTKRPILADLVINRDINEAKRLYPGLKLSQHIEGALKAEGWNDNVGGKRRYLLFEATPIFNSRNDVVAAIETIHDITERKNNQELIDSQKRFFQEILEAIPNPLFYKDINHTFLGCNKAFSAFFGHTLEEIIGKTLSDITQDELALENIEIEKKIIETRCPINYETVLRRIDGQIRTVLVTKAPFSDEDGTLCGIVGTFVDVTEQRQMDEHARKMSRAVEQSSTTIVITDINGTIQYVNPHFCKTTGYTKEEALGQNPRILKSGEMPPDGYIELWRTIGAGQEWRGEFHNRRKNGELFWENATISPLTDKDGHITGFLAVKEDITARKATEEALARSKAELQIKHEELGRAFEQVKSGKREWEETLDSLKDFVILTDTEHRVRRCNRLLCDMTGKAYDEVLAQDWRDLVADAGFEVITFTGVSGELVHPESRRYYGLNIYKITDPDSQEIAGYVVSLNDTTEIRSMTEELQRKSRELSEAQRAIYQQEKLASIGQLAAGVAHEINNPMGFISSNLSTLGKYIDKLNLFETAIIGIVESGGNAEMAANIAELRKKMKIDFVLGDVNGLLEESRDGAERVRRIVQDLKSFSHVDETECKPSSINDCLSSTLNMARNEIKYVAAVEIEFDPDLPLLTCHPQQLNQVFMNLLVNAAHAIEGHGVIRIKTFREGEDIVIQISDTGKGIAPEHLNRVFEPFFTTKEVGKGTGLGLSISYDIIKKHGGTIGVESRIGGGSTFTIRLPPHQPCSNGDKNL